MPPAELVVDVDDTLNEDDLQPVRGPSGGSHLHQVSGQEAGQALRTASCEVCQCSSNEDCVFVLVCLRCLTDVWGVWVQKRIRMNR